MLRSQICESLWYAGFECLHTQQRRGPERLLRLRLSLVPYLSAPTPFGIGRSFFPRLPKIVWRMTYSDAHLKQILTRTRRIAVVGVSPNPVRPSYYVARYLSLKGYDVVPVNPGHAGTSLFGKTVVSDLSEIQGAVDMVDIFRRSEAVPAIVDEALQVLDGLETIWMQIGVSHAEAAAKAEERGITVIQNRCPKIEYQRLFGELRMGGFATGVISSKLP